MSESAQDRVLPHGEPAQEIELLEYESDVGAYAAQ
jgi:hypothetical protein